MSVFCSMLCRNKKSESFFSVFWGVVWLTLGQGYRGEIVQVPKNHIQIYLFFFVAITFYL